MRFICLTLRYPVSTQNLIYVSAQSILAIAVNVTDRGPMGSVVYTANPVAFHVTEEPEAIYDLINEPK
jgi:hypothetical protein